MKGKLKIYNTIKREKELFVPQHEEFVGMYACGPTVYGDPHLGHARVAIVFDVVFRYLKHLGYKVRYVRNITDVGHMEDELTSSGEDKVLKKARLMKLEPMEVVKHYTDIYHAALRQLNCLPPSIEPIATGHIPEQIEWVSKIIESGYGYEVNGNVYFDVVKYNNDHEYGKLSGRVLEDLLQNTRELAGQDEKRNGADFALWKKAPPEHIMKWESPWGLGFPGWHLECSVMGTKYLGEHFDIHGGGMDLLFPHHECEIAQSVAYCKHESVRYWMHNNMITIDGGQKMAKSLNNFITLEQMFSGDHSRLEQAYTPMTVRFLMLSAHYRSTIDFSNKGLQDAEKGYKRIMNAYKLLDEIKHPGNESATSAEEEATVKQLCALCYEHINDDFNTAQVLADLFELSAKINALYNKQLAPDSISVAAFEEMKHTFKTFVANILGLKGELEEGGNNGLTEGLMDLVLQIRSEARTKKDWGTSDLIRDQLKHLKIQVKDGKEGTTWSVE